jgi:RNA polymerase sigma-70 factor (ECF subfamily)
VSDEQAQLERLFLRLERQLTNVVYRWLWDREEVRDVVQETFLRVWRERARVDWERAEALVYRIALNLARNRRRRRKLWRWVTLDGTDPVSDAPGPALSVEDLQEELRVRRAIEALPEAHRKVLVLCAFSDMSYDQIGAFLGISPGTVASRRSNAVAKVREKMDELERSERKR